MLPRNNPPKRAGGDSYEEFHPYGTTAWIAEGIATVSLKRYKFTGMERDEETGLQRHGVRYYAAWLGRWTSADPIGLGDGVNRFGYCHGGVVSSVDRTGLGTEECAAEDVVVVGGGHFERSAGGAIWRSDDAEVISREEFDRRGAEVVDRALASGSPIQFQITPADGAELSFATREALFRDYLTQLVSTEVGFSLLSEVLAAADASNSTLIVDMLPMETLGAAGALSFRPLLRGELFSGSITLDLSPYSHQRAPTGLLMDDAPPDVALFHELVHAYHLMTRPHVPEAYEVLPITYLDAAGGRRSENVKVDELVTVGVTAILRTDGTEVSPGGSHKYYNENQYRRERGLSLRLWYNPTFNASEVP